MPTQTNPYISIRRSLSMAFGILPQTTKTKHYSSNMLHFNAHTCFWSSFYELQNIYRMMAINPQPNRPRELCSAINKRPLVSRVTQYLLMEASNQPNTNRPLSPGVLNNGMPEMEFFKRMLLAREWAGLLVIMA